LSLFLFTILFGAFYSDINILIGAPEPGYRKSAPHTYQLPKNNAFDWIGAFSNGIWEELLYRGIILHLFLKKYSKHKSVVLSSVLFGLSHSINLLFGANLIATLIQLVFTTILGMMWGYMTIYSKSLIPAIICHYLADSPLLIYIFYGAVQASIPNIFVGIFIFIIGLALIPLVVNTYLTKKIIEYKESSILSPN
ncbi:MAG: lysostaphin resistance A-like protein, partial [Candidatus Hermodarchaeota archaeon]